MICRNHVDVSEGVRRCARCGSTFCRDCLVDIGGKPYCATCKTEQLLDVRSGVSGPLDLASIGRRFVAIIVDGVLLYIVNATMRFVIGIAAHGGGASQVALSCVSILFSLAITVTYEGLMVAATGQTIGKKALKIKVVADTGADVTTGQAWGRAAAKLIPFSAVVALFNDERKGIHDMLADTRVVNSA
jgi:uncharacterized RDD family membrane protein YckC